ncbi:MAG: acetate kinase [Caulobacteraceae bacterium]
MDGLILVLNVGSSSLKYALFEAADGGAAELARDELEDHAHQPATHIPDVLAWVEAQRPGGTLIGVGHRIVHGGAAFSAAVRIEGDVLADLDALCPLAPLHEPQALAAVRAVTAARPDLAQVACFDTAFHRTQDPLATWLGLTRELHQQGVRRYGFHGLSYDYVSGRLAALDPALAKGRVIAAHLGSGASLCAMADGRSVDTSMGFSPLDGLLMGTRPGALDPGAVLYLLQERGMDADALQDLLYHRSGLYGVSGISGDMRTLEASPDPAAREAIDLFVFRAAREAAGLVASLGGLDGVVFTGGIGEHAPAVRPPSPLGWPGSACRSTRPPTPTAASA